MGIEDEDLGEGTSAAKLAKAEQALEIANRQRKVYEDQLASKTELAAYDQQIADLEVKAQEAALAMAQTVEETLRTKVKVLQAAVELGQADQTALDKAQELLDTQKEINAKKQIELDIAERQAAIDKKRDNFAKGFIKRMTGLEEGPGDSLIGNMIFDPKGTIGSLGKEFTKLANPLNITKNLSLKVAEATMALAYEQDQAVVNFRKATGATGEFDDNIRGLERSLFTAGVSSAEAGQAVQSLFLNVTDFTEMSEAQQETLGETVAILNELGVASESAAHNIQFATKAMGMSTDQAEELQRELFTFAQDIGVSGAKIAEDFQKFGPQIAALGSEGVDAFRHLEIQAKKTGMAIEDLVQITAQFDKFDTAAQAVGKLNSILGGPFLNTLELVNETNPAERMKLFKEGIDQAGLSFDSMDYYQKKALASAMGLNEEQLALMMRGEFDVGPPQKSAEELEELRNQTAQFNTVMEELSQMAKGLAISFGPLISVFKSFLQLLSPIIENLHILIPAFAAYALGTWAVNFSMWGLVGSILGMSAAEKKSVMITGISILLLGLASLGDGFDSLALGLGILTLGWYALSAAEKTSGIGIILFAVAGAVAALAHAFAVGNSPSLVQAFMMVAAAIPFLMFALIPLMPLLPALLLMVPPLVRAFAMLSEALTEMLSDQFVTNLQLMALEIANIVDSINELSATKAVAFTATMAATSVAAAATALTGGGVSAAVAAAPAAAAAPAGGATGAAGGGGAPPTININLSVDGKEFATVVNSVEVSKYNSATNSQMYNSIINMIEQGLVKG